jgi:hypothetical protein
MLCQKLSFAVAIASAVFVGTTTFGADNELTAAEKADGWRLLFDGKTIKGWVNNNKKPLKAKVEDGTLNPHGSGGYVVVYDKSFGDFVFKCDVKLDKPECNSGIFVRTGDLKDPVQTGLEVQLITDKKPDVHGFGALYDLVAPTKNASHGPGEWDSVEIRCEGPKISVTVNGEKVAALNCDEWSEPGKRPDGTTTKFKKAVRDFPRNGYIGLQDHGHNAWFKNIKLRELESR